MCIPGQSWSLHVSKKSGENQISKKNVVRHCKHITYSCYIIVPVKTRYYIFILFKIYSRKKSINILILVAGWKICGPQLVKMPTDKEKSYRHFFSKFRRARKIIVLKFKVRQIFLNIVCVCGISKIDQYIIIMQTLILHRMQHQHIIFVVKVIRINNM